jgi:hypothetical protein
VKGGNIKEESVADFVKILDEYQEETKRRYSTHIVQKLIKSYEGQLPSPSRWWLLKGD